MTDHNTADAGYTCLFCEGIPPRVLAGIETALPAVRFNGQRQRNKGGRECSSEGNNAKPVEIRSHAVGGVPIEWRWMPSSIVSSGRGDESCGRPPIAKRMLSVARSGVSGMNGENYSCKILTRPLMILRPMQGLGLFLHSVHVKSGISCVYETCATASTQSRDRCFRQDSESSETAIVRSDSSVLL